VGRAYRIAALALLIAVAAAATASAARAPKRAPRFGTRVLYRGMRGADVKTLQQDLTAEDFKIKASGYYNQKKK